MIPQIQIDADGPLDDQVTRLMRKAVRDAREGVTTHVIDRGQIVATIGPPNLTGTPETGYEAEKEYSAREVGSPVPLWRELESLINAHSRENESNTPDYILAKYLIECLTAFESATTLRDKWYGVHLEPANAHFLATE